MGAGLMELVANINADDTIGTIEYSKQQDRQIYRNGDAVDTIKIKFPENTLTCPVTRVKITAVPVLPPHSVNKFVDTILDLDENHLRLMIALKQAQWQVTEHYSTLIIPIAAPVNSISLQYTYIYLDIDSKVDDYETYIGYIYYDTDYRRFLGESKYTKKINRYVTIAPNVNSLEETYLYDVPMQVEPVVHDIYIIGDQPKKLTLLLNEQEREKDTGLEMVCPGIYRYHMGSYGLNLARIDSACLVLSGCKSAPVVILGGFNKVIYGDGSLYESYVIADYPVLWQTSEGYYGPGVCGTNDYEQAAVSAWAGRQQLVAIPHSIYTMTNLALLDIRNNKLTSLDLSLFPKLKILKAQHNLLSNVDLTCCPQLREVHLSYNTLTSVKGLEALRAASDDFTYDITGNVRVTAIDHCKCGLSLYKWPKPYGCEVCWRSCKCITDTGVAPQITH